MKKFSLPEEVQYILGTIEDAGYEAWCVGGCVRDMLMGVRVNDYDIASGAPAAQIHRLFDKVIDTGIKHGTVTVVINNQHYEITQYRIDGEYRDSRHPENATFTDNFRLDLSRRDFTMNAIGYHPARGLFDPYNGEEAIKRKQIVAVGDASLRFEEDALRIMRALRFSSVLGFEIEKRTLAAAVQHRNLLQNISAERIQAELFKLLSGETPSVLSCLTDVDLSKLDSINPSANVRFASMCVLLGKDAYVEAVKLKTDRATRKRVGEIYSSMIGHYPESKPEIKMLFKNIAQHDWIDTLQAMSVLKDTEINQAVIVEIIQNNEPYLACHLDLTAGDRREISNTYGGEKTKQIFEYLTNEVILHPENNSNKILKRLITQNCTNS